MINYTNNVKAMEFWKMLCLYTKEKRASESSIGRTSRTIWWAEVECERDSGRLSFWNQILIILWYQYV